MRLPQHGSWFTKIVWMVFGHPIVAFLFLTFLGAIAGFFSSPYAQRDQTTMVSIGAVWGAFIAIIFISREKSAVRWLRRTIGCIAGAAAGVATGVILGWAVSATAVLVAVFCVLGFFGHAWAKHLTYP